jgi:hypothetical protein
MIEASGEEEDQAQGDLEVVLEVVKTIEEISIDPTITRNTLWAMTKREKKDLPEISDMNKIGKADTGEGDKRMTGIIKMRGRGPKEDGAAIDSIGPLIMKVFLFLNILDEPHRYSRNEGPRYNRTEGGYRYNREEG